MNQRLADWSARRELHPTARPVAILAVSNDFPNPAARQAALGSTDPRRSRRAVLAGVGEARNRPEGGDSPTDARRHPSMDSGETFIRIAFFWGV